jgi:hypothetical protein
MTVSPSYTLQRSLLTTAHTLFSAFTSRYLVAAFNDELSSSSVFPNCLRPQLTGSHFSKLQLSTELTRVGLRVSLRLAVYRKSVHLGAKPLEDHDQRFIFQLNLTVIVLIYY